VQFWAWTHGSAIEKPSMGGNSMSVVCAIVAREEQAAPRRRTVNRSEVLAHRIHVQQLDRGEAGREITDAAVFDFGVQDTGRDGASWALANRGVPIRDAAELEASPDVALVWTLRRRRTTTDAPI
jgi:hypothetical protein